MSRKKTAYNENIYKNYRNRLHKLLKTKFMLSDGSVTDDKQTVAEKFNDFFVDVGPNLAK